MRLLYITDALAIYGGLERVLSQKVNWLAEHGYDVYVLTANQGSHPFCFSLHPKVHYDDLNVLFHRQYCFPIWKRLFVRRELNQKFRQGLKDKIREFSPDLIVCLKLDYVRNIIRVKGDIPFIYESHSSCLCGVFLRDSFTRRLYMWYLKLSLNKADAVVALTNGDAKEWRRYSTNVYVIPNVVTLNNGQLSDCSSKSAIFVGRFTKQKDVDSLLQIWSIVYQQHPEWKLNIFGGYGSLQEEIMTKVSKMDIGILVHSPSSDIIARYKENSMLLFTSIFEPFGLVLPEAMSCGLPVVAFDCPYGPADIVSDGIDGFLVKDRNCKVFADKVCMLMNNLDVRRNMGESGAQLSRRYEETHIMPIWNNLFVKLLKHERV